MTHKSSLVILREQTANILATVTTLTGELRLLRLAFEGSQDGAAHLADQRLIQHQAAQILDLKQQLAELTEEGYQCEFVKSSDSIRSPDAPNSATTTSAAGPTA